MDAASRTSEDERRYGMMKRFVKTYYASRHLIDLIINIDAKKEGLSIVSVSISNDNIGGIYASVLFEEKPKSKKKGGEG